MDVVTGPSGSFTRDPLQCIPANFLMEELAVSTFHTSERSISTPLESGANFRLVEFAPFSSDSVFAVVIF